jgi:hypothetical protein
MKIFIILGTGNSGAGAIHDYLLSREDFFSPFNGKEFRLVNDPDGIDELYNSFYKNFSFNGATNKFFNFKEFTKNFFYSRYNTKNKILDKNFLYISEKFSKKIISLEYNGSPQFYLDKINIIKKINFYFQRFILKKNPKNINLLNMILPCDEKLFLSYCENYLNEIFKLSKDYDENKNIVIEQGGNFLCPISSTKYYGLKKEVIFVERDPKAIFWSMKRRNSMAYPGHNVKLFVKWFREMQKKINFDEYNKIIKIRYEDFFSDFEEQKIKLCHKLNISLNTKDNFNLVYTKKNLFKFRDQLSNEEIKYIDKELKEYT